MKVSYEEDLANHFGLRRRCDCGNNVVLSVRAGGSVGQLMSSEIRVFRCRLCHGKGKATSTTSISARRGSDLAESLNLCMRGKFQTRVRFEKFGLKLHKDKTRLIEFGRYAARNRKSRGEGRPETFDFLGFTHRCDVTSNGWFALRRATIAKRLRATIAAIKVKLIQRRHWPIDAVGKWLRRVCQGWLNYHAIPGNLERLTQFLDEVKKLWLAQLRRRSQRHRMGWSRFTRIIARYLPLPKTIHPFPSVRFHTRLKAGAV